MRSNQQRSKQQRSNQHASCATIGGSKSTRRMASPLTVPAATVCTDQCAATPPTAPTAIAPTAAMATVLTAAMATVPTAPTGMAPTAFTGMAPTTPVSTLPDALLTLERGSAMVASVEEGMVSRNLPCGSRAEVSL